MVYISSWQEYQEAAEALYEKSPTTVRLLSHHAPPIPLPIPSLFLSKS